MSGAEIIRLLIFFTLLGSICAIEAYLVGAFALNRRRHKKTLDPLLRKSAIVVHLLAATCIACYLYAYFIEPYQLEVNTFHIPSAKLSDVALRIVQISDLHCDRKIRNERKLVRIVNSLKPDIIVFTGDTINTMRALPSFKGTLRELNASLAKLAVRGNTDLRHWAHIDLLSDTGFELLDNRTVALTKNGRTIYISGVVCRHTSPFKSLLEKVPPENFSILLCHQDDLIESLGGLNVDLYLCGHTHGGQVTMPWYGPLITLAKFGKKYESGMYRVGDTTVYVNRGIGMEGGLAPRVRFLARPEIAVFEIEPASAAGQ